MAMTERHDEQVGNGRRMSTGEFRAVPDISASTAQFRAFAEETAEAPRTWDAAAPERSRTRIAILIAGVIVVLAIIAILSATLG
jgi:cytochrome b